jgi:hypothetical protein
MTISRYWKKLAKAAVIPWLCFNAAALVYALTAGIVAEAGWSEAIRRWLELTAISYPLILLFLNKYRTFFRDCRNSFRNRP